MCDKPFISGNSESIEVENAILNILETVVKSSGDNEGRKQERYAEHQ